MTPDICFLLSAVPLGFLVADGADGTGAPTLIALYALLITQVFGLVNRLMDNRKEKQAKEWAREDEAIKAAEVRADLLAHRQELADALRDHIETSARQLEAARANLSVQASDAQTAKMKTAVDTNATAHRIEGIVA